MKKELGYSTLAEFEKDKEAFLKDPENNAKLAYITNRISCTTHDIKREIAIELISMAIEANDPLGVTMAARKFLDKDAYFVFNTNDPFLEV